MKNKNRAQFGKMAKYYFARTSEFNVLDINDNIHNIFLYCSFHSKS